MGVPPRASLLSVHCFILLVLSAAVCVHCAASRSKRATKSNMCAEQLTCGDCFVAGADCGWCTQEGYDVNKKARCDLINNLKTGGCDPDLIVNPGHNIMATQNNDVADAHHGNEAIQLKPQQMTVKLRPNTPFKFDMTFRQAENYPVDLYIVMDLSCSMVNDKKSLANMADNLATTMASITTNFRLGFGSFVEKKTLPFVSMIPSVLEKPCAIDNSVSPYGFKHHMTLTNATSSVFRSNVENAAMSGNLDTAEGGFDAIMQAIACQDQIGWRDSSRKMLLYVTDAGFHFAGDGKLGGIVKPNDGNCHLDSDGYYTESVTQDYPSIGQLAHGIADKKLNIIFAVIRSRMAVYQHLSEFIEGSVVAMLLHDSSNIVDIIRSNYLNIASVVELKAEGAEDIDVQFRSKCFGTELVEQSRCEQLGIGENVTFEVEVMVKDCPEDRSQWQKTFSIYPVGLTEKLDITLNLACECDCEIHENITFEEIQNSAKCNASGTFECGACTCDEGNYGKNCECDGSILDSNDYDADCKQTNTSDVCESHGQCICGVCACRPINSGDASKRYSGKFCQCDDFSCDYYDNELCAGPDHGVCDCGTCTCNEGFKGSACECPTSNESCRAKNGLMCNGKGSCHCSKCTCDLDTFFRGSTCEDCPTCEGRCAVKKACVQCVAHSSGPYTKEYCDANCAFVHLEDQVVDDPTIGKLCSYNDDDDCMFYFTYEYDSDTVVAQRTKECREPVNVLAIVLGVVLGTVSAGLVLLLIWKLLTTVQDRKELASFEKERANAKWDRGENPIYRQAVSTFKNPTYAGKSQ